MTNNSTNWDHYYSRPTPKYTAITRSLSTRKLVGLLSEIAPRKGAFSVCEFGGANSCFVEALCEQLVINRYHVIDLNEYGLNLLKSKSGRCPLTWELQDILSSTEGQQFDVVYSVGLIEHFDSAGTAQSIASHFARCVPGGVVLMTFPTPTLPYNIIRTTAEILGRWNFPDERPLAFEEVVTECRRFGTVVHQSINWGIGLTQGYVVARKAGDLPATIGH
jgi:2-polyprenyl-3-methyl-5-hydroxy-6-metoxy-1,4-benzoquinol methylase